MTENTKLCRAILGAGNAVGHHLANEVSVLPFMQAMILSKLYSKADNTATSKELAQWFQVTPSAVSGIVKRMRHAGLVTTHPNTGDKRILDVTLTEEALALEEQVSVQLAGAEALIRGDLSADEIACLFTLLDKIKHNISGEAAE